MKPAAVESTTLLTIAYDVDRQLLQLEFRDRANYHYFDVPADVYQGLVGAPSKGSYSSDPSEASSHMLASARSLILALMPGHSPVWSKYPAQAVETAA
jgi:hypothetical protein